MKLSQIILKEEKNCGCGQTPCITYGVNEEKNYSRSRLMKLANAMGPEAFTDAIIDMKDENVQDMILDELGFYEDDKGQLFTDKK
jgi:hypothetical protein